jgi:hypothetical protein
MQTIIFFTFRVRHSYVTRMYSYVTRIYSCVTRMYSYVLVCYSYVTRMYSCGVLVTIAKVTYFPGVLWWVYFHFRTDAEMNKKKQFMQLHDLLTFWVDEKKYQGIKTVHGMFFRFYWIMFQYLFKYSYVFFIKILVAFLIKLLSLASLDRLHLHVDILVNTVFPWDYQMSSTCQRTCIIVYV